MQRNKVFNIFRLKSPTNDTESLLMVLIYCYYVLLMYYYSDCLSSPLSVVIIIITAVGGILFFVYPWSNTQKSLLQKLLFKYYLFWKHWQLIWNLHQQLFCWIWNCISHERNLVLTSESKEDVSSSSVQVTVKKGVKRKADTTTPLSSDQVSFLSDQITFFCTFNSTS